MARFYENDRNTPPSPPRPPRPPFPMPPTSDAARMPAPMSPSRSNARMPAPMSPSRPTPRMPSSGNARRPSSAGGDRDAMIRAYMSRMEMPEEPRVSDLPNMTVEEMAPYNRPAPDINDAFFGPDSKPFQWTDIIDFLMGKARGGER